MSSLINGWSPFSIEDKIPAKGPIVWDPVSGVAHWMSPASLKVNRRPPATTLVMDLGAPRALDNANACKEDIAQSNQKNMIPMRFNFFTI